jgi:hypothetical protein
MTKSDERNRKRHHPPVEANEMFYIDKDGKKSDRAIHEFILKGISPEGVERLRQAAYESARKRGMPEHAIRQAYGNPGDPWD